MHLPHNTPTALLLVDLQLGLTHPTAFGATRSTPNLESNITALLASARAYNASTSPTRPTTDTTTTSTQPTPTQTRCPIHIIHVHHHSISPLSPLHPSSTTTWCPDPTLRSRPGTQALPCATPVANEPILTKYVNSAFIGTDLESLLRGLGVRQLVVTGMTTEHCVSTTVRMAANLNVVGDREGRGERGVVVVGDGCAAFGKGIGEQGREKWSGEVVHEVELECLGEEFGEVVGTEEVVRVFGWRRGDGA